MRQGGCGLWLYNRLSLNLVKLLVLVVRVSKGLLDRGEMPDG